MANNYEAYAFAIGPDVLDMPAFIKLVDELDAVIEDGTVDSSEFKEFFEQTSSGDAIVSQPEDWELDENGLYAASSECYHSDYFTALFAVAGRRGIIKKSFSIKCAHTCSSLRIDEFGGDSVRFFPDGSQLCVGTSDLGAASDDTFKRVRALLDSGALVDAIKKI